MLAARSGGGAVPVLEDFTHDTFAGHVGETFRVRLGSDAVAALVLIEATDLTAGPDAAGRAGAVPRGESFSLLFRGPSDRPLPQATYSFEHATIGPFELFIVPVAADADGIQYEAVFN